MIKRLCICLSLILIIFALSGCQRTGDEAADTQTEMETVNQTYSILDAENESVFESGTSLSQTTEKTIAEMVQIPERVEHTSGFINIDAEVILPETDSMSVALMHTVDISEKVFEQLCDTFFTEAAVVIDNSVLQKCIEMTKNGGYIWLDQSVEEIIQHKIDNNSDRYISIDLTNPYGRTITCYYAFVADENGVKILSSVNDSISYAYYLVNKDESENVIYACVNSSLLYFMEQNLQVTTAYFEDSIRSTEGYENICPYSSEEVLECVNKKTENIILDELTTTYLEGTVKYDYEPGEIYTPLGIDGYVIRKEFCFDGIRVIGRWNKYWDSIGVYTFRWNMDDLQNMNCSPIGVVDEIVEKDVELLPFSRIEEVIKDYIDEVYLNLLYYNTGEIRRIALEYSVIFDENDKAYAIVPSWNVYEMGYRQELDGVTAPSYHLCFSVNAIDGSIISPWLMYE